MKSIVLVCEGRFGMGGINRDVDIEEMSKVYEGEEEFKDEYLLECEKFEGGIVCGSGDDGVEFVIGDDNCSLGEMWEKLKEYGKEIGYGEWMEGDWLEMLKKNIGERVELYDYNDYLKGGKYYKGE